MLRMISLRPHPKNSIGRFFWITIWGSISLIAAFGPIVLLNAGQLVSLVILPFSILWFRRLNTYMAWMVWGWWDWGIRNIVGVTLHFEGDRPEANETAVVIANHQSMADILCLLSFANRSGMKDAKFMSKDVIKYVPFFGWSLKFIDFIMLKRNWSEDAATIMTTFGRYCERPDPFWMFFFPEGTRIRPEKLEASRTWAKAKGLPVTSHVMLPRPKGFLASLAGLEKKLGAVYDVSIFYGRNVPALTQIIRGELDEITVKIKRYDIDEVPKHPDEVSPWLTGIFCEKDQWINEKLERNR